MRNPPHTIYISGILVALLLAVRLMGAQVPDNATLVHGIDSSVNNRLANLAAYTVTEHYAVFRGQNESKPAAEMLVKTIYRKGSGKSYTVLSQSGSALLRREILGTLLDHEKKMSEPGKATTALINSANYDMKLASPSPQKLDGRDCLVLDLNPRRSSEYLFRGKLWVDAKDYSIVQLEGTASKSAFFLASAAQISRQYTTVDGMPMATHARAVSNSGLLGQTVVKVDYTGYQVQLQPSR